ncbi:MAG: hypothetical protein IKP03_06535 [Fibrobacter sp.]|nr:hypothetical protein [Fibrobacter sp.]
MYNRRPVYRSKSRRTYSVFSFVSGRLYPLLSFPRKSAPSSLIPHEIPVFLSVAKILMPITSENVCKSCPESIFNLIDSNAEG